MHIYKEPQGKYLQEKLLAFLQLSKNSFLLY